MLSLSFQILKNKFSRTHGLSKKKIKKKLKVIFISHPKTSFILCGKSLDILKATLARL